jgi:hypothetical protein
MMKYRGEATAIIFVAIVAMPLAMIVLPRPIFYEALGLNNKGQVGDLINGILGPIIAFMSAILLYFTLISQIDANEIQQQRLDQARADALYQSKFDFYLSEIKAIKEIYSHILYQDLSGEKYQGVHGLYKMVTDLVLQGNSVLVQNEYILDLLAEVNLKTIEAIAYVSNSELDADSKAGLIFKIDAFYSIYQSKYINSLERNAGFISKDIMDNHVLRLIERKNEIHEDLRKNGLEEYIAKNKATK